jgi:hypothetical protein
LRFTVSDANCATIAATGQQAGSTDTRCASIAGLAKCEVLIRGTVTVVVETVAGLRNRVAAALTHRRTKLTIWANRHARRTDADLASGTTAVLITGDGAYIRVIDHSITIVIKTVAAYLRNRFAGALTDRRAKLAIGTNGQSRGTDSNLAGVATGVFVAGDGAYIRVIDLTIAVVVKAVVAYLWGWSHADLRNHKVAVKAG